MPVSERDGVLEENLGICGSALRLRITLHEGRTNDRIDVFGGIGDAERPGRAEVQDIPFPFPLSPPGKPKPPSPPVSSNRG